jgi:hypothetical protein
MRPVRYFIVSTAIQGRLKDLREKSDISSFKNLVQRVEQKNLFETAETPPCMFSLFRLFRMSYFEDDISPVLLQFSIFFAGKQKNIKQYRKRAKLSYFLRKPAMH